MHLKTSLGRLRILALLEGLSFLILLFITMPIKYLLHNHQPNLFFGFVHGLLFVLYVLAVIQVSIEQTWPIKKIGLALLASIVPFGTFWADKKLFLSTIKTPK